MKTNITLLKLYVCLLLIGATACQKVIKINLNSAVPKVVIEGIMHNGVFGEVSVSKTTSFYDSTYFNGISGAFVTITDNTTGLIDTLMAFVPGRYQTTKHNASNASGVPGHTYSLLVKTGGQTYTAVSTMPDFVRLDTAYTIGFPGFGGKKSQFVVPKFTYPNTGKHYFLFTFSVNNILRKNYFLLNNIGTEGKVNSRPIAGNGDFTVKTGESVTLYMQCIDYNVYNYFYSLSQNSSPQTGSPANPVSNISNGALGYFSACTVTPYDLIVP